MSPRLKPSLFHHNAIDKLEEQIAEILDYRANTPTGYQSIDALSHGEMFEPIYVLVHERCQKAVSEALEKVRPADWIENPLGESLYAAGRRDERNQLIDQIEKIKEEMKE